MSTCCIRRVVWDKIFVSYLVKTVNGASTKPLIQKRLCSNGRSWHLMSAVCLERLPVISRPLTDLESRFSRLQNQLELEKSVLSDHEMRHKDDMVAAELRSDDVEETQVARQTALELEDSWEAELAAYNDTKQNSVPVSETEASMTSVDRELDKNLVLLVKQKKGDKHVWMLPEGSLREGETLRQTAQHVLDSICGETALTQLLGNAPSAFYDYVYPKDIQESTGHLGSKVFILKAIFNMRDNCLLDDYDEFKWVTKRELSGYLNSRYKAVVNHIILST